MAAGDVFNLISGIITTVLALGTVFAAGWLLIGRKFWTAISGTLARLGAVEKEQQDQKTMNQDAFKEMRTAITEEFDRVTEKLDIHQTANLERHNATITRLDHINGSVGQHEGRLNAHDLELARIKVEKETEEKIFNAFNTSARLAGKPLSIGNPPPDEPEIDPDLKELV